MLVHGQGMEWEDYASVLPELSKCYHVFAVDCFGHGESAHDPSLYTCSTNGDALTAFAGQVIGDGGVLYAATTDEDAARIQATVPNCETVEIESGRDIHYEHPDVFARAIDQVAGRSGRRSQGLRR